MYSLYDFSSPIQHTLLYQLANFAASQDYYPSYNDYDFNAFTDFFSSRGKRIKGMWNDYTDTMGRGVRNGLQDLKWKKPEEDTPADSEIHVFYTPSGVRTVMEDPMTTRGVLGATRKKLAKKELLGGGLVGAGIGAATGVSLGSAIGALAGNAKLGSLIGAGVGAVGGGTYGAFKHLGKYGKTDAGDPNKMRVTEHTYVTTYDKNGNEIVTPESKAVYVMKDGSDADKKLRNISKDELTNEIMGKRDKQQPDSLYGSMDLTHDIAGTITPHSFIDDYDTDQQGYNPYPMTDANSKEILKKQTFYKAAYDAINSGDLNEIDTLLTTTGLKGQGIDSEDKLKAYLSDDLNQDFPERRWNQ